MSEIIDDIVGGLKKTFTVTVVIAAAFFVLDVVVHKTIVSVEAPLVSLKTWGYFLFIISIFTGVGMPIFLRSSYHRKSAENKIATIEGFRQLQHRLLISVFISCISADIAYLFPVQILYLYGAFFSCIYGIYSVIPYRKKIAAELKFYKLA